MEHSRLRQTITKSLAAKNRQWTLQVTKSSMILVSSCLSRCRIVVSSSSCQSLFRRHVHLLLQWTLQATKRSMILVSSCLTLSYRCLVVVVPTIVSLSCPFVASSSRRSNPLLCRLNLLLRFILHSLPDCFVVSTSFPFVALSAGRSVASSSCPFALYLPFIA